MKRFVTYLYEYERTIRGRNVGFIRNDIRNDCCRMEIHIRGLERIKEKAPIFIIVRDSECIGIPAGEVVISQGVGNACLELRGNRIGKTDYSVNNIQAVIVRYNGGKMLMGCYVQHPAGDLLSGTFTKWEAQATPASPTPDPDAARGVDSNSGDLYPNSQNDLGIESNSGDLYPKQTNNLSMESNSGDLYPHDNNLQGTATKTEEICPTSAEAAQSPIYKRIAITDIRSLPSRNWHLCNNSFLVHGFFCYHYLILKTINAPDGAKMYLGVPGIYASQERMMALLFGFNDFEIATDNMMGKSDTSDIKYSSAAQNDSGDKTNSDSQPSAGDFGYWLCPLET